MENESIPRKLQIGDSIDVRKGKGFVPRRIIRIFYKLPGEDESGFVRRVNQEVDLSKFGSVPGDDLADNDRYREKVDPNALYIVTSEEDKNE